MSDRKPSKELRARSYSEKLRSPLWQKKRLEVFNAAGWKCQECKADDQTLNVHHSFYPTGCSDPWDVPADLLMCLCEAHHRERQEVEQRLFVAIARRLCALNLRGLQAVEGAGTPTVAALLQSAPPANCNGGSVSTVEPDSRPPRQMHLAANDQWL